VKGALVLLLSLTSALASAQERYLIEGIFDTEIFSTDSTSPLLSKNAGDIAVLGRLTLWSALQISSGIQ